MNDEARPRDVHLIDPGRAFADPDYLDRQFTDFLASLAERTYAPRTWVLANARVEVARERWGRVVAHWRDLGQW